MAEPRVRLSAFGERERRSHLARDCGSDVSQPYLVRFDDPAEECQPLLLRRRRERHRRRLCRCHGPIDVGLLAQCDGRNDSFRSGIHHVVGSGARRVRPGAVDVELSQVRIARGVRLGSRSDLRRIVNGAVMSAQMHGTPEACPGD